MAINKDSFCVFRWDQSVINFGTSELTTCCRTIPRRVSKEDISRLGKEVFQNHDYLLERRKEMLEGVRHSDCRECWDIEAQGQKSFRKLTHNEKEEDPEKFLERISHSRGKDKAHYSHHPESLILFIGNTCDLKCIYCSNSLSTSWAAEDLKFGKITKAAYEEMTATTEGLDDIFWQFFEEKKRDFRHISFVGGEPLTMKRFYNFLDRIEEIYRMEELPYFLTLGITSNLNASEKTFDVFLESLKKLNRSFYRIKIDGSIDTTGDRAAYIRNGVSWERWHRNFTKLLQLENVLVTVIPSVSCLSVPSFQMLLEELGSLQKKYKKKIMIQENVIMTPQFLSPYVLTPEYAAGLDLAAKIAREKNLQNEFGKNYGDFLDGIAATIRAGTSPITHAKYRRDLHAYLEDLKVRRDLNHLEIFPELRNFFDLCEIENRFYRAGILGKLPTVDNRVWIRKEVTHNESPHELYLPIDGSFKLDTIFWDWFELHKTEFRHIILSPGEAVGNPRVKEILASLKPRISDSVGLSFSTNLSSNKNQIVEFVRILEDLECPVGVTCEYTSVGDTFGLFTSGLPWSVWLQNMKPFLELQKLNQIEVAIPIYPFSIPALGEVITHLRKVSLGSGKKIILRKKRVPFYLSAFLLPAVHCKDLQTLAHFIRASFQEHGEELAQELDEISYEIRHNTRKIDLAVERKKFLEILGNHADGMIASHPSLAEFLELCRRASS